MPADGPLRAPPAALGADPWQETLSLALEAGRRAHPALRLDAADFAREATARIDARLAALGLPRSPDARRRWLEKAAHADLALAAACAADAASAWETLTGAYRPRLEALARSRGADPAEAERLAAEVLGDLVLPASASDPRPLLGTYAGGGSLFAFLAVLLQRKRARRARDPRERRRVPLETGGTPDEGGQPRASTAPTPTEGAEAAEDARCFERALAAAVDRLTPAEALALALKHRDGHSQRTIATVLGVGEPRVSRIVASAVGRLAAALAEHCPGLDGADAPRLLDVLGRHLATWGSAAAPSPGRTTIREDA